VKLVSPNARPDRDGSSLNGRTRTTLTVAWCAFLSASVSTMVFFAFVDPSPVVAVLKPTGTLPDRTALYSLGFLFFFGVCALAASLTAWLINSHPRDAS
jgi:hypothetical protein